MALQTSGPISFADLNNEIGNASNAQLDLQSASDLLQTPGAPYGMDELYGKTIYIPTPTYSITPSSTIPNEGSYLEFSVITSNVTNGTVLYWEALGEPGEIAPIGADFEGSMTGTVTINSNAGTFGFLIFEDQLTEGEEVFRVRLRTGSITGPIVASTDAIFIQDTSLDPPPPPPSNLYYRMISCSGVNDIQFYNIGSPQTTMYVTSRNEYFYWDGQAGSPISLGLLEPTLNTTTFTSCAATGSQV